MFRLISNVPMHGYKEAFNLFETSLGHTSFKVDVIKQADGFHLSADVPGFKKEEITIRYEKNYLTLEAVKESHEDHTEYVYKERTSTELKRRIYLPDVNKQGITAKLENGVLNIFLPISEDAQETRITIEE